MDFAGKSLVLAGPDLEQMLLISPSEEGLRQARESRGRRERPFGPSSCSPPSLFRHPAI